MSLNPRTSKLSASSMNCWIDWILDSIKSPSGQAFDRNNAFVFPTRGRASGPHLPPFPRGRAGRPIDACLDQEMLLKEQSSGRNLALRAEPSYGATWIGPAATPTLRRCPSACAAWRRSAGGAFERCRSGDTMCPQIVNLGRLRPRLTPWTATIQLDRGHLMRLDPYNHGGCY